MKTTDFLERQQKPYLGAKKTLKRRNKVCKKNHGKPHEFVLLKEKFTTMFGGGMTWKDYKCTHCGKLTYTFRPKAHPAQD